MNPVCTRSLLVCLALVVLAAGGCATRSPGPAPAVPQDLQGLFAEADGAIAGGRMADAEAVLERALRVAPRSPLVWYRLADLRLRQGRLDAARQLARRGLRLARGDARMRSQLWLLLAEVERRAGDPQAAEAALREAGVR